MDVNDAVLASHLQERRRGTIVLAVLPTLQTPGYGYALLEDLGADGIEVDANTLYPHLRRLEKPASENLSSRKPEVSFRSSRSRRRSNQGSCDGR